MIFAAISGSGPAWWPPWGFILVPAMVSAATTLLRGSVVAGEPPSAGHSAEHPHDHLQRHRGTSVVSMFARVSCGAAHGTSAHLTNRFIAGRRG